MVGALEVAIFRRYDVDRRLARATNLHCSYCDRKIWHVRRSPDISLNPEVANISHLQDLLCKGRSICVDLPGLFGLRRSSSAAEGSSRRK